MADGRYAMLEGPKRFTIGHRPVPQPGTGEIRVRVHDVGVCGSDLKMWAGTHAFLRPPLLIGHEIYGTVEALGAETNGVAEGTPVVVFPPVGCGLCFHCASGHPQICADMRFVGGQIPGGLAEHVIVPSENVVAVPQDVPSHERVLVEPLAVGVHAAARARAQVGECAAVIGAGAIGLFTALAARARGVDRILVGEPSAPRRARADALGFETFDPDEVTVEEAVAERLRPEGADIVFECVGSETTIGMALGATRNGGRAVVVGNAPPTVEIDGLALQRGDRSLVGVLMYDRADLVEGIRLLSTGLLAALREDELVQPFELDEVHDAFAAAKDGSVGAVRAVVRP
jgi:threonine dehydrogenase-like Zn-dependent dehydrogenase